MKIEVIELDNFLCYYGENELSFDDGPTIIIGQNQTGKSKLFDGFNWAFFDLAFDNDQEKWFNTKSWKERIVNDRIKNETKIGKTVITSVRVEVLGSDKTHYSIHREYYIKKIGKDEWKAPNSSELYLTIVDAITKDQKDKAGAEAQTIINGIFPSALRKYFFFQGETINEVMSLNKRSAFENALNGLSKIEVFKNARDYAAKAEKKCYADFNSKTETDRKTQTKKNDLTTKIEDYNGRIERVEEKLTVLYEERDSAKSALEKKEEDLSRYSELKDQLDSIKTAKDNIDRLNSDRKNLISNQKEKLLDTWIYAGTEQMLDKFSNMFSASKKRGEYPEPVTIKYLHDMIEHEKCLICKREAKKGSKSYNTIKSQIEARIGEDEDILQILEINTHVDTFISNDNSIKNQITDYYKDLEEIDTKLEIEKKTYTTLDNELEGIIPDGMTKEKLNEINFEAMFNAYREAENSLSNTNARIATHEGQIKSFGVTLDNFKAELDNLLISSTSKLESRKLQIAQNLHKVTKDLVKNFMDNLLDKIQTSANLHFKKMTKLNQAHSGNIIVDYDKKEVFVEKSSRERMTNINQANKVSLQISFVAAILSVSNEFWSDHFPFIADAPISALGGDNKISAVDTMTDIFQQSIIILKDDAASNEAKTIANDPVRKMINEKEKIKNAYELHLEGEDENSQVTIFRKVKG